MPWLGSEPGTERYGDDVRPDCVVGRGLEPALEAPWTPLPSGEMRGNQPAVAGLDAVAGADRHYNGRCQGTRFFDLLTGPGTRGSELCRTEQGVLTEKEQSSARVAGSAAHEGCALTAAVAPRRLQS